MFEAKKNKRSKKCMFWLKKKTYQRWKTHYSNGFCRKSSRTIAPEANCPPTPKLTLTQPLTLTGGQFSTVAIVWLSPNPKTNPNLDPSPNPKRGQFSSGSIVRIPSENQTFQRTPKFIMVDFYETDFMKGIVILTNVDEMYKILESVLVLVER